MAPYHGIITAGLRNNRRYIMNSTPVPSLHYKSPVKHHQQLSPPVVLSFPDKHLLMWSTELARNLPGIHHQARESGNPRIDFMEVFGDAFEHFDDREKLSEAGQWVYAVISSLEQTQYSPDPFCVRIREPQNPLALRIDDMLFYRSASNFPMEYHAAEQILHLFQAISDILQEDRRLGVFEGFLSYEFFCTAMYLAPYISDILHGPGMLMLLRAISSMSGHDYDMTKRLIELLPMREQDDLLNAAFQYYELENKILGRQIIKIITGI